MKDEDIFYDTVMFEAINYVSLKSDISCKNKYIFMFLKILSLQNLETRSHFKYILKGVWNFKQIQWNIHIVLMKDRMKLLAYLCHLANSHIKVSRI
jgi:hypothetical protein